MSEEYWKSSPFGEDSMFHPSWEEKQAEKQQQNKRLSIKFVEWTSDDKYFHLTFEITAKNLSQRDAKLSVVESEVLFNETAVPETTVSINPNGSRKVTVRFSKDKKFSKTWFEGEFEYIGNVRCDSITASSAEFRINNETKSVSEKNKDKKGSELCICKRDLTIEDVKEIVKVLRENTTYEAVDPKTKKKQKYPLTNLPYLSTDKIFHRNTNGCKYKEEVKDNSFNNFCTQLNAIFNKYEINNCKRRSHFLSQIFIETEYFTKTIESDNSKTDGYDPYRGRGFIHLTGKDWNYIPYKKDSKIDVVSNYSIVATNLAVSADVSGWFWKRNNLNKIADTKTVTEVTKIVQGGASKLSERANAYNILLTIFDEKDC